MLDKSTKTKEDRMCKIAIRNAVMKQDDIARVLNVSQSAVNRPLKEHGESARVGISGTIAKSRQRKFVPSSHPGPFALVASSHKSETKVGTLACFIFL